MWGEHGLHDFFPSQSVMNGGQGGNLAVGTEAEAMEEPCSLWLALLVRNCFLTQDHLP